MKFILYSLLVVLVISPVGCNPPPEKGVIMQEGIRSDDLGNNIVTRPIVHAFSALVGEGIEIRQALTHVNKNGFLELEVSGYNRSFDTRRFEYKVEWLDGSGMLITSHTSKWMQTSAAGKSPFTIKAVAPRTEAVDFRMNTRKIPG